MLQLSVAAYAGRGRSHGCVVGLSWSRLGTTAKVGDVVVSGDEERARGRTVARMKQQISTQQASRHNNTITAKHLTPGADTTTIDTG